MGLHIERIALGGSLSLDSGCRIVGNPASVTHIAKQRISLPRTRKSRHGQLLEIARLNHAHHVMRR